MNSATPWRRGKFTVLTLGGMSNFQHSMRQLDFCQNHRK